MASTTMYTLTGGLSISSNPAYATDRWRLDPKDDFEFPDYDGIAIGGLPAVLRVPVGKSSCSPGLVINTGSTVHREEKVKLALSTPHTPNIPRSLFPHISINVQSLIPRSNVAALISNRPCSSEVEVLVELLQKNFPEKCCKINERVTGTEHLKGYFDSQDILSWGSLFLSEVIEEMVSRNEAKSANGTYLKQAHIFTRKIMRKRLKEFYWLPQPPTARGHGFGQNALERFGEIWLDRALRRMWLEAKIYYKTINWMRDNDEDFTGTSRRPKPCDIFTEEQLRDFSDVDLDEACKVVWLYQNHHYGTEVPMNNLPNGVSNTDTNGISGTNGGDGSNGTNITTGSTGSTGSNGRGAIDGGEGGDAFNGRNGSSDSMEFYDPIPAATPGRRPRGNHMSDPETRMMRQLHQASSHEFGPVVRKECFTYSLVENPSSGVWKWNPDNLMTYEYLPVPRKAINLAQQPPSSQNPSSNHLAIGGQLGMVNHPPANSADQITETTASTPTELVAEASSSDQIVYDSSALEEDVSRDNAPNPDEVETQPSQQPVNLIQPVIPDQLVLRQHIRNEREKQREKQLREPHVLSLKEATTARRDRMAEKSNLEATRTTDTQHDETNAESDHEAEGSKLPEPKPESDGSEVNGPEQKSNVEDVSVASPTGHLSSDAPLKSDPNNLTQSDPVGNATQSTEKANPNCDPVHKENENSSTEEGREADDQPSPEMKISSEKAKGKLPESLKGAEEPALDHPAESGIDDAGDPSNDPVPNYFDDEHTAAREEAQEAKRALKKRRKREREKQKKHELRAEEEEKRKLSLAEKATTDEHHRSYSHENSTALQTLTLRVGAGETAGSMIVEDDTPNRTEPAPVQNQGESPFTISANTPENSASTETADKEEKRKVLGVQKKLSPEDAFKKAAVERYLQGFKGGIPLVGRDIIQLGNQGLQDQRPDTGSREGGGTT